MTITGKHRDIKPKKRRKKREYLLWRYLVAFIAILFALAPLVWIILSALNPTGGLATVSISKDMLGLNNFRELFNNPDYPYLRWYRNSLMVSSIAAVFQVLIGTMSAYAFSRIMFKGRRLSLGGLLLLQMFPQLLSLVAIFLFMSKVSDIVPALGIGTFAGLTLVYLGGAMGYNTYLIKGFFDTIPRELDEAATVDGASANQIFFKIILPLAAPILAVVALLAFIGLMNDFVLASIFLTRTEDTTLAVGLHGLVSGKYEDNWGIFAAGALLAAIPVVILFQLLQRFIVEGLAAGSVKG